MPGARSHDEQLFCVCVFVASQVLYRLQPDSSRESAVGYITNLTDSMEGKTLKVSSLCTISAGKGFLPSIEKCFLLPPIIIYISVLQNCLKVQKLLQDNAFGPSTPASTLKAYEEKCSTLLPLATAFRPDEDTPTTDDAPGTGKVKENAPKNVTIEVSAGVLKESALSSAAMSDLSGDINVAPVLPKASIDDSIITDVD